MTATPTAAEVEIAVAERYSSGALAVQSELCCPSDYDPRFLEVIPAEVLERDYGCGDPSRHLHEGETVLDLGSGGGKLCFIAAQIVGPTGSVTGVDINDDMLALARSSTAQVAEAVGYSNVAFLKGRIQDLALDVEALESWLDAHPVVDLAGMSALEAEMARSRRVSPLVADDSVDVVVSNCVLNLVATEHKSALFSEIFRVLRRGGRAVISDIVSDVEVPEALRADPELWSGCVSGAFQEEAFLAAFEGAGFYGISIERRDSAPWRTLEGVEFRSMTVVAYKGKQGECRDHGQSVIYRGPWRAVLDDDDHVYQRGAPTAVCAKTFALLGRDPYTASFERLEPAKPVDPATAPLFVCAPPTALPSANSTTVALRRPVTGMGGVGGSAPNCC